MPCVPATRRYRSISRSFLRDADGVILMYDVTNQASFANVNSWMVDVQVDPQLSYHDVEVNILRFAIGHLYYDDSFCPT